MPRILLVDQSEALANALRAEERQVLEVTDVGQALMVAAAFRPDAIVLGITPGTRAGLLSAAMLKLDAATSRIPLICLLDPGTDSASARAAGCAITLPAAVPPAALATALDQVLGPASM